MSGTKKKQDVPAAEVLDVNVADLPPQLDAGVYHVSSFSPGPAGASEPCTQVHLRLPLQKTNGEVVAHLVLRLKSARALDELVGVLLEHRRTVWP